MLTLSLRGAAKTTQRISSWLNSSATVVRPAGRCTSSSDCAPHVGLFHENRCISSSAKVLSQTQEEAVYPMTSHSCLREEATWAVSAAKMEGLIGPEDSSVLFHSFNAQAAYLDHLVEAFDHPNALHAVSIKTNPHPAVLANAVAMGFGLEAASMEEVRLAQKAGCVPSKIVFDSPVKRRSEIDACHNEFPGIRFNANSLEELRRLPEVPNFPVGLRINPMIKTTGASSSMYHVSHDESKFGVPIAEWKNIIQAVLTYPIVQLHVHSGSAMSQMESAVAAVSSVVELAHLSNRYLEAAGLDRRITTLDIGGGLLPEVLNQETSNMKAYANALRQTCPDLWNFELITEFGQWTNFYTGYAHSDVEYAIQHGQRRVVCIHLGADYLLRDAYVKPRGIDFLLDGNSDCRPLVKTDIAGPLCFAGDYLAKGIELPCLNEGDGLILLNTGSNTYGLWSRHCSRSIPKVIGVDYASSTVDEISPRMNPFT